MKIGKIHNLRIAITLGLALSGVVPVCMAEEHIEYEQNDTTQAKYLETVVVTSQSARQRIGEINLGSENLDLSTMAKMPMLFGENDIIKSITLLPGVHGEGDGGGGFEVRGGTASQNLIQIDGITLYNPAHVMGIFSTFNDNALGMATLHKGPIPTGFGGATASVLETTLAPGDMKRFHGVGTIGILAAKAMVEGPIVKDKLSFAVSARRSYVDAFLQMIPKYRHTIMNFYDITAKMRYRPRQGDYLDLSFIIGHDNMAIKRLMGLYWGNLGGSLNWLTRRGDNLTFITTAAYTDYSPKMTMSMMNMDQTMKEYIRNASVNEKIQLHIGETHVVDFGLRSEFLRVKSAEMEVVGNKELEIRSGWQNAAWVNYENEFAMGLAVSGGVRVSLFSALSGKRMHKFLSSSETAPDFSARNYVDVEPRISLKYSFTPLQNVKVGYGVSTQNLHSIRSSSTSFPFDRYALTSAGVKPEKATQYGIGYSGMTENGDFDWSAEGYYKDLTNVYDYADGRTMFSRINLESIILGGRGRSYGGEFMIRKNNGKLTGWISYTISKTQTKIPGINGGRWYDATNDRRHDIAVTAIYALTDKWTFSGSWIFSSGQPLTAPDVKYQLDGITYYYYSQRNGYRTPPTHRLDLSAVYTKKGKRCTTQWAFGIFNAYCRYNPYVIYFEDDLTKPSGTRAVQQALFGLIPSVSYTLTF
ncbi:MAG: TonB-dependent receptor plug domain-containing protein [Muribaculaceae bacterium]|nr:TonB-dependent receptor plug domain-containing protein [Muribaculaceae bacterium]